jgi:hypothetical protein
MIPSVFSVSSVISSPLLLEERRELVGKQRGGAAGVPKTIVPTIRLSRTPRSAPAIALPL